MGVFYQGFGRSDWPHGAPAGLSQTHPPGCTQHATNLMAQTRTVKQKMGVFYQGFPKCPRQIVLSHRPFGVGPRIETRCEMSNSCTSGPGSTSPASIEPTLPADREPLLDIARRTGVFKPHETVALAEVLDDYHATNRAAGHVCVTYRDSCRPQGFAYFAPAAMTDRTWYLYWIAVDPAYQAQGIGKHLMKHVESEIRSRAGRILLIETSSLDRYDPTRSFYIRCGYAEVARLPDFYADGDSMVVFEKRLHAQPA